MILADTSVWIELLGSTPRIKLPQEKLPELATCGPVIQEVLQGVRNDLAHRRIKEGLISLPRLCDPLSYDVFDEASEIYRLARKRGISLRSSVDCLIAAIAIRGQAVIWHRDRDFDSIARFTGLQVVREI